MSGSTEEAGSTAADPAAAGSNGSSAAPEGGGGEAASALADRLLEQGAAVASRILRLARIRVDQFRLSAQRARSRLLIDALLVLGAAVVLVSALVFFARGLSGGLAVLLGGREWLGELAAGFVLFGLLFVGAGIARARAEHARLQDYREKYENDGSTQRSEEHAPSAEAPSANGGGIPGAPAGANPGGAGAGPARDRR